MARILLVDPPLSSGSLNIGLASIASYLLHHGHDVHVLDLNNRRGGEKERILSLAPPDIIGVSVNAFTATVATQFARQLSGLYPKAKIVAGGPEPSSRPLWFLHRFVAPIFDFVVCGDGEPPMLKLAENCDSSEINGLWSQRQSMGVSKVENLDMLPFPNYGVFDSFSGSIENYPLMTSRGCLYSCIFCLNSVLSQRKWRSRSPRNVLEEILYAKDRYRFKRLDIWDDGFTTSLERAKEILHLIEDARLDIEVRLQNGVRADKIDAEFLNLLRRVGGKRIWIGAEDLTPETAENVGKKETPKQIEDAIRLAKIIGFDVGVTMIIGLPGQTKQTVEHSLSRVRALGVKAQWFLATPFVGTKLYEWVAENARTIVPPDHYSLPPHSEIAKGFREVVFDTENFTREERLDVFYRANISTNDLGFLAQINPHLSKILWQHDKLRFVEFQLRKIGETVKRFESIIRRSGI